MAVNDILIDDDGNIVGFGDSSDQNLKHLINCEPGEARMYPLMGVGIRYWLQDDASGDLTTYVRRQVLVDGGQVSRVVFNDNELYTNAKYE